MISIDDVIPAEYRELTDQLFPATGVGAPGFNGFLAEQQFAKLLGIDHDFIQALHDSQDELVLKRLLIHFQNNVELLIHKTWVEKADEAHKEKLLTRIPRFVNTMESGQYDVALQMFIDIEQELAYLLFGAQSHKGDFLEYTFRIDSQIGLFWWYAGKLSQLQTVRVQEMLRVYLLIGICFLAAL
ncbi:hypothetical protein [Gracilinema caldarium]|uniref:Uncharacterized protein n=1 Tax=Gracilinema caldarium (strain ATCC 51460 / DSM 7334 / H1) TaxID=744872 RepID=F8EX64_GRAC1|nr:hypothetical protein [Gracilinema caldarium]AEJ18807.1 hypothetical protein Spica_0653 [Gracilinema caldarium DSM 7334]